MIDIISILPDSVANQIAAGEVVQRPSSVVKELVENAVDAGSTSIIINVKDAGRTLIQVIDNGLGMSETDARMAFERHATSKIKEASDLFAIRTMGFRGEALASIAAVAEVSLKTKRPSDEMGTQLEIAASQLKIHEPVSCSTGSNFMIKNLFFNIPARRKFLKSEQTELRHIINDFQRIALAYPEIGFKLVHNDGEIYNLPGSILKQRIAHLFGKSIVQKLATINTETSIIKISGFVGKPEDAKKTAGEQFFFINNRFMKHPYFHRAVMNAYHKLIPADFIPSYFIYFEADPETIDINIHPTKTEIKFENEKAIFQMLHSSVKEGLGRVNLVPSIDFETGGILEIPLVTKNTPFRMPEIQIDPTYNPFETDSKPVSGNSPKSGKISIEKENIAGWEQLYSSFEKKNIQKEFYPGPNEASQSKIEHLDSAETSLTRAFQLRGKYIVTPVKSGLMLIDQRHAHIRILFDQFLRSMEHRVAVTQAKLYPESIELNPADYPVFIEIIDDICSMGFDISDNGSNTIVVKGCPAELSETNCAVVIEKIIDNYKNSQGKIDVDLKEKIALSVAKATAINYDRILDNREMKDLIDSLFACPMPNLSPEGKKIITILEIDEIYERFL